jgi:hypothetical protein
MGSTGQNGGITAMDDKLARRQAEHSAEHTRGGGSDWVQDMSLTRFPVKQEGSMGWSSITLVSLWRWYLTLLSKWCIVVSAGDSKNFGAQEIAGAGSKPKIAWAYDRVPPQSICLKNPICGKTYAKRRVNIEESEKQSKESNAQRWTPAQESWRAVTGGYDRNI